MSIQRPTTFPFVSVWAEKGEKIEVPENGANHDDGHADIETGFPKQTMISALQGGVPPWGTDHNGILNRLTEAVRWNQAGGMAFFNQDWANRVGGYANGTILQGDNSNRPWVLWQCVQDGNTFDPNQNKINVSTPQNGWIRYPVISGMYGNILYYDDNGQLLVASPSVQTVFYVSSSTGNDTTGNGTKDKPYFSIFKALQTAPSTGSVTVYLKAQDTHYFTPDGMRRNDDLVNTSINLQTKNVIFASYDDQFLEDAIQWNNEHLHNSGNCYSYVGVTRPKFVICWTYLKSLDNNNQPYISNIVYTTFSGTSGAYSISFLGIEFEIDRIDEMDNVKYPCLTGWLISGGSFVFSGCIFNRLPKNGLGHFIASGGNANGIVDLSFTFRNFFKEIADTTFLYHIENVVINTFSDASESIELEGAPYKNMQSNVMQFFSKPAAYHDHVEIIYNPSKNYKNLNVNFGINLD